MIQYPDIESQTVWDQTTYQLLISWVSLTKLLYPLVP